MYRIEYGSQLWCLHSRKYILALEKKRFYAKHIEDLSYECRLAALNIFQTGKLLYYLYLTNSRKYYFKLIGPNYVPGRRDHHENN